MQSIIRALFWSAVLLALSMESGPVRAAIVLDGDLVEWTALDRLDTTPGSGVSGYEVYGRYEGGTYYVALRTDGTAIGPGTTVWLNTDQNPVTGHQIFGFAGGAEYNVNVFTDSAPYLYTGAAAENFQTGPLPHAYGSLGSVLELAIDETLINVTSPPQDIDLLLDVNDVVFLPADYSIFVYTILAAVNPGTILVDGDLGDWTPADRLGSPPQVPAGYELYGRRVDTDYVIGLQTDGAVIGAGTTVWFNTDEDATTGYQIFGFAGGAEYNVNFFTDDLPYLYTGAAGQTFVSGPLAHAYGAGGTVIELRIPAASLNVPAASGTIGLLIDVNNSVFLPPDYSIDPQFVIPTGNVTQVPAESRWHLAALLLLLAACLLVALVRPRSGRPAVRVG